MPHEINRILRAFASRPWFIDAKAAEQIIAILDFRAAHGPRAEPYAAEPVERQTESKAGSIAVLSLMGPIVPRSYAVDDLSGPTVASMENFMRAFDAAANNPDVSAIVLNVDSPGGAVDLVPEMAAKIRAARREDRPIVAVANTFAASAAYWIASAADELVVTPSGEVGSIGVYMLHEDVSAMLETMGVRMTFIQEGPRKVEGNPFEPLGEEARNALQKTTAYYYDLFVRDVARQRRTSARIVRADPEKAERHFGGGRTYPAQTAVDLGMADRIGTLEAELQRLQKGTAPRRSRRSEAFGEPRAIAFVKIHDLHYVAADWPQSTRFAVGVMMREIFLGSQLTVDGDVVSVMVENGWADYSKVGVDDDGAWQCVLIDGARDDLPPPEVSEPRKPSTAGRRRRLAIA